MLQIGLYLLLWIQTYNISGMKQILIIRFLFILLTGFIIADNVYSQYPGQFSANQKIGLQVPVKAYSFDLNDVKLLDSPFKENMKREQKWLLSINNNRLLHSWRVNAGMSTRARPYAGWEGLDVELRGHTMGHVLS